LSAPGLVAVVGSVVLASGFLPGIVGDGCWGFREIEQKLVVYIGDFGRVWGQRRIS